MNPTDPKKKYLVAAKDAKTSMYECLGHQDHVIYKCLCNKYNDLCKHSLCVAERANLLMEHVDFLLKSSCPHHDHVIYKCLCNKYNGLCKHSLCVAGRANLLMEHVDFLLKSSCPHKPSKSNLVEPQKAGKKGSSYRNPRRPGREKSGDSANSQQGTSSHVHGPYSAIHHNDKPLIVCFLSDQAKATECRQCRIEFPRHKKVTPYEMKSSCLMRTIGCTPTPKNRVRSFHLQNSQRHFTV